MPEVFEGAANVREAKKVKKLKRRLSKVELLTLHRREQFEKLLMVIFVFTRNLLRATRRKNYYFYLFFKISGLGIHPEPCLFASQQTTYKATKTSSKPVIIFLRFLAAACKLFNNITALIVKVSALLPLLSTLSFHTQT